MNWHEVFKYSPETGTLVWNAGQRRAGKIAGTRTTTLQGKTYLIVKYQGRQHYAHRVIWEMQTGNPPSKWIDHVDGVGTNNKWTNLREATPSQNGFNRKVDVRNKVGVTGVHFDRKTRRFKVTVTVRGVRNYFGSYESRDHAVRVAKEQQSRLFGEYVPKT